MKAKPEIATSILALVLALDLGEAVLSDHVGELEQDMVQAPKFKVDPF